MDRKRRQEFLSKCLKQMSAEFWDIIKYNPDKNFDWVRISRCKFINLDLVLANLEFPWHWRNLAANINITIEDIEKYPEFPWEIKDYARNLNLKMEDVLSRPDVDWYWPEITHNPSITWQDVIDNQDKNWDTWWLYAKKGFTPEIFDLLTLPRYTNSILCSPDITWDFVKRFDDLDESSYSILSQRKCITIDIIRANPDLPWDYDNFSDNPTITPKIVEDNPDIPWNFENLTWNNSFTIDYINNNMDKKWNWTAISWKDDITIEFILKNMDKPFCTEALFRNPSLDFEELKELFTPHKVAVAANPNFTFAMAKDWKFREYWEADWISHNMFIKDQERIIVQHARLHLAAFRIQNRYKNALVNPYTELGKRKALRDFEFFNSHYQN